MSELTYIIIIFALLIIAGASSIMARSARKAERASYAFHERALQGWLARLRHIEETAAVRERIREDTIETLRGAIEWLVSDATSDENIGAVCSTAQFLRPCRCKAEGIEPNDNDGVYCSDCLVAVALKNGAHESYKNAARERLAGRL